MVVMSFGVGSVGEYGHLSILRLIGGGLQEVHLPHCIGVCSVVLVLLSWQVWWFLLFSFSFPCWHGVKKFDDQDRHVDSGMCNLCDVLSCGGYHW